MQVKKTIFPALLACLLLCGCMGQVPSEAADFFAMDTAMTVLVYGEDAKAAVSETESLIEDLDRQLSIFNSDSEFYQFNTAGQVLLSSQNKALLEQALELARQTDGAFDPTIEPVVACWGFYGEEKHIPGEAQLQESLSRVGYSHLQMEGQLLSADISGVKLDLGGIAKGYASDRAVQALKDRGVTSAVLSLGGNVQVLGAKPGGKDWTVGITDPLDPGGQLGTVSVRDMAVVTSGVYQRYFEEDGIRYHHIFDAETGYPADSGLLSVSIVCPSGTLADGLSTALFVMGLEEAAQFWRTQPGEFDAIFVTQDGEIYITAGLEGVFSSSRSYEVIAP